MTQASKKLDYAERVMGLAKYCAKVTEEVSVGLMGFIPNGLDQIYDYFLKSLPLLGRLFRHRWVEQVIKLCCGITIGKGLASDIGRFIFWPIGFSFGALVGAAGSIKSHTIPVYRGQIRKFMYKLSAFTVPGALLGGLFAFSIWQDFQVGLWGVGIGALLGSVAYLMYMVALTVVLANQDQIFQKNAGVAKNLGAKLRELAKQRAKGRILVYAQDTIQQMNGPDAQLHLTEFFEQSFEAIAQSSTKKIDRHFYYLTERASHGDSQALARLQALIRKKSDLDGLLDRLFNARAIAKIKDEVDTYFDKWFYRFLKA